MLLHVIRADLRRFRLAILSWLVLEAVVTTTAIVLPALAGDPQLIDALSTAHALLWLAAQLLAIVLVVLVVQTHPLVGTDAFWMTRPIPPSRLLASKLALLGTLMIAVPVARDLLQMTIYHVPAGEMARVVAQTALWNATWLGIVMAGAAVTSNLARFATLIGAALASVAMVIAASLTYFVMRTHTRPPTSAGPDTPDPTGDVVALVLTMAAAFLMILIQYRNRSRTRAGTTGIIGLAFALTIGAVWPWPVLRPFLIVPDWAQRSPALHLTADGSSMDFNTDLGWSSDHRVLWRTVRAKVWLGGLEPGWSATVGLLDATVALESGVTLQNAGGAYASAVPIEGTNDHPEQVVLRHVLDVQHLPAFHLTHGDAATVFTILKADWLAHASEKGIYHGRFRVNLTREEIAGILPLRPGLVFQDGPYRLAIDDVLTESRGTVQIHGRQSNARSVFDRRPAPSYVLYLRNRQTSEAVIGSVRNASGNPLLANALGVSVSASQAGFDAQGVLIRFPPEYTPQDRSFSMNQSWLDRAELVIVRSTREGSVDRELSFDCTLVPASSGPG